MVETAQREAERRLFNKGFSTNRIPLQLPSTGQRILLRETTVTELKSICMTVIDNFYRKQMDVVYDAVSEYLQAMVLTEGVDVQSLTEFDRLYCLMIFFQMAFFKDPTTHVCPNCRSEISYRWDMSAHLGRMDQGAYVPEQQVDVQVRSRTFRLTLAWPLVREMSQLNQFFYNDLGPVTEEMERTQYGVDFVLCFVKRVQVLNGVTNQTEADVDLTSLDDFQQRLDVLNSLPQAVVFDRETGVFDKVVGMFVNRLENCFRSEVCPVCHADTNYGLSQSSHFHNLFLGSLKGIYGFVKQVECLLVHRYDCFVFQAEQYITYNELNSLVKQLGTTIEKENEQRKKDMGRDTLSKGLWMIREILNNLVFPQDRKH